MPVQRLIVYVSLAIPLLAAPAEGRMYRWTSPESGRIQLSGQPPAWYRSGPAGPRVLVFENGRLIDDTAVSVSQAQGEALRKQAFQQASLDRQTSARRPASPGADFREPLEDAGGARPSARIEDPAEKEAGKDERNVNTAAGGLNEGSAAAIERLKAIIADWENRQTQDAKRRLGDEDNPRAVPAEPTAPSPY